MYLITGYRTFDDARITYKGKHGRELGGNIDLPIDTIASMAGAGLPISLGGDVGFDSKIKRSAEMEEGYTAPGEQIYAVQYRQLTVRGFRSRSLAQVSLDDKIHWEDVFIHRGDKDEEEEDMVGAELAPMLRLGKHTEKSIDEGCEDEYLIIV
jgi:hypothetical protein